MAKIIILCGVARSGKSTYVNKLREVNKHIPVISRDIVREHIFGEKSFMFQEDIVTSICDQSLKAVMIKGLDVVVDNTHLSFKRRRPLYQLAKQYSYEIEVVRFFNDVETLLERGRNSDFPEEIILTMLKTTDMFKIEYIDKIEYPNINIIDIVQDGIDKKKYLDMCVGFEHDNPHHHEDVFNHMCSVADEMDKIYTSLTEEARIMDIVALFHDIGKIYTKAYDESKGWHRFLGHDNIGGYMAFGFFNEHKYRDIIVFMIASHMSRFQDIGKKFVQKIKDFQDFSDEKYGVGKFNIINMLENIWLADTKSHVDHDGKSLEITTEKIEYIKSIYKTL